MASNLARADAANIPLGKPSVLRDCTERLRILVQRSGGTKQVALRSGVALSTLGSYLAGGEMKLSTAMQLCAACNTTLAWLVGDDSMIAGPAAPQHRSLVGIRIMRSGSDDHSGPPLMVSSDWLRARLDCAPERMIGLEVHGSAMEPTLHHGDLLLVDTGLSAVSSLALHVLEIKGELLVRRLERCLDGSLVVHTDNPRFTPRTISPEQHDALKLVGRVIWKGSSAAL